MMTDDVDDLAGETPADVKAWFRRVARTEGLKTAYRALVSVCEDAKAAAPAKATAAGFLLRAAGMLDRDETPDGKDPSQMTRAEMMEEYARLTREAEEAGRMSAAADIAARPAKQSAFD